MREKNQVVLPIDLEICIPKGDFVFKLVEICEELDYTKLFETYLRSWRKVNPITVFELLVIPFLRRIKSHTNRIIERVIADAGYESEENYAFLDENGYESFIEYRKKSLANITSDEGILLRMNRSIQVEGVFGVLKQDYGFRRFLTRGTKKIETQFFLLAFAFNIQKLCNRIEKIVLIWIYSR